MITNDLLEDITPQVINKLKNKNLIMIEIILGVAVIMLVELTIILNQSSKIHQLEDNIIEQKDEISMLIEIESFHSIIGEKTISNSNIELNDTNFINLANRLGAYFPEILLASAKIESGLGVSDLYKKTNNLFGMKSVYKRQTTQTGSYNGYGTYKSWELSLIDRILWDKSYFDKVPDIDEYYESFKTYAEDKDYIQKLKLIQNENR